MCSSNGSCAKPNLWQRRKCGLRSKSRTPQPVNAPLPQLGKPTKFGLLGFPRKDQFLYKK